MGIVYLINESGTNNYKIGVTKSTASKRKLSLQTGNSNELEIVKTYETKYPYRMETMLHMQHFNKRGNGEWFELETEDVLNFITLCDEMQKRIDFLVETNPFFSKNIK